MDYRIWLKGEFDSRRKKNPRYSLRSFARSLDTDASTVSQIINGKRRISEKLVNRLCDKLSVDDQLRLRLVDFVKNQKLFGRGTEEFYHQLSLDTVEVISKWYHYAILELTYTTEVKSYQQISQALGISVDEATEAVKRLVRLDLLRIDGDRYFKSEKMLTLESEKLSSNFANQKKPSAALIELQKHVLKKALRALDECHPEERDITSMTMAIDVDKLPAARELIAKFRRDMCAFLENGNATQVYNLGIALYPVSKKEDQVPKLAH